MSTTDQFPANFPSLLVLPIDIQLDILSRCLHKPKPYYFFSKETNQFDPLNTIASLSRTCKLFYQLANEYSNIWKQIYIERYGQDYDKYADAIRDRDPNRDEQACRLYMKAKRREYYRLDNQHPTNYNFYDDSNRNKNSSDNNNDNNHTLTTPRKNRSQRKSPPSWTQTITLDSRYYYNNTSNHTNDCDNNNYKSIPNNRSETITLYNYQNLR